MWGQRNKGTNPSGYTDNVYRSRQSRGSEGKSRFCCFYFTRSVVSIILLAFLLAAGALAVVSVVFGYSQRWTYNVNRDVNPVFSIRTGWLYFSTTQMAPGTRVSLKSLSKASYILGIIAFVMSCLSVGLAAMFSLRTLCGRIGRGFICCSIPFSILLIAALGGYYIVTALEVYQYSGRQVQSSRVPWPDWAWGLGAGGAVAWFIAAGVASLLPQKHKYLDAEEEFETGYPQPARGAAPRSGESPYLPSSPEPPMPNGSNVPMAAQENPVYESTESQKKSFLPTWSKRGSGKGEELRPSPVEPASQSDAPAGSYRAKAEEVAHRYRSRNKSEGVEMSNPSAPPVPKSAW